MKCRFPVSFLTFTTLCILAVGTTAVRADDARRVVFDFESGMDGWKVVEGEFADLRGERPAARYRKQGKYYLTTLELNGESNDPMVGVIESPVFTLQGKTITMLVGGGDHDNTYVALCLEDGTEVFQARGKRSEAMDPVKFNARKYIGKKLFVRLVDFNRRGWGHIVLDNFQAEGTINEAATAARFVSRKDVPRRIVRIDPPNTSPVDQEALRAAIKDLTTTFGARYPKGKEFLARLDQIEQKLEKADDGTAESLAEQLQALQREALIANPLVSGQPIIYVSRLQYRNDHHNTATMFQTGEINTGSFTGGGAIRTIDFGNGGKITTLLETPEGVARDIDVDYDGKKILFSLRHNIKDDYHIYEMKADGSELTQLTVGSGISDIDPIYLPDDRLMFGSTREPKFCMCNRHIMCNLFTMDADGANIQQIGHSTLHEGHPAVLSDGRILYDRWEYIDRNFGDAQGVWVCNPDGTAHVVYWGNNTNSPGGVLDSREIPGTELFICNFSSCHDRPWGALAIVDRRIGIDGKPPVLRTWPANAIDLVGVGNYDTFVRVKPKYEDPYPLSDKYFLCSRMVGRGELMGIYLLDLFGNEILLHVEEPGCFDPMPLAARERPMAIPSKIDLKKSEGYFYVSDVYIGNGMDKVERGTVKKIRVVESPEKRFWTQENWQGSGTQAPGMAYNDFNNKRIIGTAPVEADGSAYFSVPPDTWVYFQLLDENDMLVQSMRSGTITRPGETGGCVGCHESRRSTIPNATQPLAMQRAPSKLEPWYGPTRKFGYVVEVQPAFDKHCTSCHDYGKPAGEKLNLAGDLGMMFNTSYYELRSKGLVKVPGAGPFRVLPPMSWGSHASRLGKVVLEGHGDPEIDKKINLDKESFDRIITWIDINAPYYPHYASAYRNNRYGRAPISRQQLSRLNELTGMNLGDQRLSSHVSFTRPEKSLCLTSFEEKSDPKYKEALAIIQAGKDMLAVRPRADMPGFQLVDPIEITQEAKYQERLRTELEMRAAIAAGEKHFEKPQEGGKPE